MLMHDSALELLISTHVSVIHAELLNSRWSHTCAVCRESCFIHVCQSSSKSKVKSGGAQL